MTAMRLAVFTLALGIALSALSAQSGPLTKMPADVPVLNNDDIVTMVKGDLGPGTIIAKIRTSQCHFDTSTETLIKLKQLGVVDSVLEAMATASPTRGTVTLDPNNPMVHHPAGIYVMKEDRTERRLTQLEPTGFLQRRQGMPLPTPVPVPITRSSKATIVGGHARLQLTDPRPTFYLYFDATVAPPNQPGPMASATHLSGPNLYTLVRLEAKSDRRLLDVGGFNPLMGMTMGVSPKSVVEFDFERLADGIYKIWPRVDMAAGEYCFLPTSGFGYGTLMDFGITPGR